MNTLMVILICVIMVTIFFCCIPMCILFPRKTRKWFVSVVKYFFERFCVRFVCNTSTNDMEAVIERFKENVPDQATFLKSLQEQFHLRRVLDVLNATISEFQFSIMPSGSLREGFGKLQPATSALASDYDMMLIPEDCFAQLSIDLNFGTRVNEDNSSAIFEAVRPPGTDQAFCWLKLKDNLPARHQHWKEHIIYKKLNGEDIPVLSNDKVRYVLKDSLTKAKNDLEYYDDIFDILKHGEQEYTFNSNVEINGPAVTIKIQKKEVSSCGGGCVTMIFKCFKCACMASNSVCCCGRFFPLRDTSEDREIFSFYSDFTLAICCKDWPKDAQEWVARQRNWPNNDVVQKVRNSVIHIVPKPSTSLSPITFVEAQPESIDYGDVQSALMKSSGTEFRFSFSQAEAILSLSVPDPARETYLAFKSTIKRLQESINIYYKIESFALKSMFYRTLEILDPSYWSNRSNLKTTFLTKLCEDLRDAMHRKYCPHYWIETVNLFESFNPKIDDLPEVAKRKDHSWNEIMNELNKLVQNPIPYVLDDWVEHNRCLIDHCCFIDSDNTCRCLPVYEIPYSYIGGPGSCCGPLPTKEEKNEVFATY